MIGVSMVTAMLTLTACKPTEKNYKAAYDAAKLKREAAAREQMRPATGLLSDDGPLMRVVNGDTIYVLQERLRNLDGTRMPAEWLLAVGVFKMDTNAKAGATRLRENGFPQATVAKGAGQKFYTVVSMAESLDSVISESKRFRTLFPEYPFIGLPGAPVMVSP